MIIWQNKANTQLQKSFLSPKTIFWVLPIIKCKYQIFECSQQITAPMIKYLFQSIIHIIHPRSSDTGSTLNSVQVCHEAHSNKMWVIKFILKTDEGWELNFVVIFESENEVQPGSSP